MSLSGVRWLHTDVSDWRITSRITDVDISSSKICIEHTKAGDWPGSTVEGNPWIFAKIDGRWYAATYEWLKSGQICKGITRDNIGPHTKKEPIESWKPKSGELVGFMISGLARSSDRNVKERSQVVMIRWP